MTKSTHGTWSGWTGEKRAVMGMWRMAEGEKVMQHNSDKKVGGL